jgi:hypothetical protein
MGSFAAEPAPLLFKAWVAASLHGFGKKTLKIFRMVKSRRPLMQRAGGAEPYEESAGSSPSETAQPIGQLTPVPRNPQ